MTANEFYCALDVTCFY